MRPAHKPPVEDPHQCVCEVRHVLPKQRSEGARQARHLEVEHHEQDIERVADREDEQLKHHVELEEATKG